MRFVAVGDVLLTRRYPREALGALLNVLGSADARFVNFETTVPNGKGYPASDWGGSYTSAPAQAILDLAGMGFNLFGRANNHVGDWCHDGVIETSRAFGAAGVVHAGVGDNLGEARRPGYLDLPVGKVALVSVTTAPPGSAYRAGHQRTDCQGRPGASCLRFTRTMLVPEQPFEQLRTIMANTPLEADRRHNVDLGFQPEDTDGILSVGAVRFMRSTRYGEVWAAHPGDLREIMRAVVDARRQACHVIVAFHAHEASVLEPSGVPSFHRDFCHMCIDAGADAVIGHGPHRLRGIEVYAGRPIFYSLGNFIFENEEAEVVPADFYERLGLEPLTALPADAFDRRNSLGKGAFLSDRAFWRSVMAWWDFSGDRLNEVRLYPIDLQFERRRGERGRPIAAGEGFGQAVATEINDLSIMFGTRVQWSPEGYAMVSWTDQMQPQTVS